MASSVRTRGCKFCPRHPTKELILVCKQCNNEPVCLTCLSTAHIGHTAVDLDIVAQEKYNYIQDINDTIEEENIPTIRTNLQIAEEKVRTVEQEILTDIKRIEEHHTNIRDLLKRNATAAISKMKATIEANKQKYENFESRSEQNIESLKGQIVINNETCKSKNNILTLDAAQELENIKFEIPTFEKISTEKFHPGTNTGDYITAVLGSVVHDDEDIPIPIEPEISTQQSKQPQQKSSLLEQHNQNLPLHVKANNQLKTQDRMKRPTTKPKPGAVTGEHNTAEDTIQAVSSNHPIPAKFYYQLVPVGKMYSTQLPFPTGTPVFFNDGTLCDSKSYREGYLACRDSSESDLLLPLSSALQFDTQDKKPQLDFQISDMKVNSIDDKLYLMISDAKNKKSMWSLDRHTEKMVKLFGVKENVNATCSKFALTTYGDILIGDVETELMSFYLKVSVYSHTGECIKKKAYKIPVHREYRGRPTAQLYSPFKWNNKDNVCSQIAVCQTTGMVALVGHASYSESHKHMDTYGMRIMNYESLITKLLVLDENFEEIYRKHQTKRSKHIEFDRFGYLLLVEQDDWNGFIDIFKATTGQPMAKVSLFVYNVRLEFCCLNNDSDIVAKMKPSQGPCPPGSVASQYEDESLQIFRYIYREM